MNCVSPRARIATSVSRISARSLDCTLGCRASSKRIQLSEFDVVSCPAKRIVLVMIIRRAAGVAIEPCCVQHLRQQLFFCQLVLCFCVHIGINCEIVSKVDERRKHHLPSKLKMSRLPFPGDGVSVFSCTISLATSVATFFTLRACSSRGFDPRSVTHSSIYGGIYLETARMKSCCGVGSPKMSILGTTQGHITVRRYCLRED